MITEITAPEPHSINFFILGKSGTGKSYLMNKIIKLLGYLEKPGCDKTLNNSQIIINKNLDVINKIKDLQNISLITREFLNEHLLEPSTGFEISGFVTLPYYIGAHQETSDATDSLQYNIPARKGFYFHSLKPVQALASDLAHFENDIPVSVQYLPDSCIPIPQVFSSLGKNCLLQSMNDNSDIIVMDELGRFEKDVDDYIETVDKVLDSSKIVIAVLKDEPLDYIHKIKARDDVILFDLSKTEDVHHLQMEFLCEICSLIVTL